MVRKFKTLVTEAKIVAKTAGQALVEFALAATLIFFMLSAAIDLGMIFFAMQGLHNSAQEGSLYGSAMPFQDQFDLNGDGKISGKKEEDFDGDDFIQRDIFNDQAGEFYPEFLDEVRRRASYEAGTHGGIGFTSLRDLDSDGEYDDVDTLREYIEVNINNTNTGEPCGDPNNENCTIHVKVTTDYRIQFPLAPALPNDKVRLSSEFSVELSQTGFTRFGRPNTDPITATLTPLPTTLAETPTTTPSPTPTQEPPIACDGFLDSGDIIESPWSQRSIGEAEGVGSASGGVDDSTIKMCGAGLQVYGKHDNLYYVYTERTDPSSEYQEFTAKITDWQRPGIDDTENLGYTNQDATKAGLMIRTSVVPGAPLAFVGYRPKDNKVIFQYRSQQLGSGDDKVKNFSAFVDASDPPVWFRLRRLGTQVKAWYSTDTGDNPTNWTLLTGNPGGEEWVDVEGFTPGAPLSYGTALISGYKPDSSKTEAYPHQFGKATFSDVAVESTNIGMSVRLIKPTQRQKIASLDEMNFESEIEIEADDVNVVEVKYWIVKPDGSTILILSPEDGEDNECYFGGSAGNCNAMSLEQFEQLTERGDANEYTVWVRVEFDDPENTVLGDSKTFTLQDLDIRFVVPEQSGWELNNPDQTNFEIEAYDPTVGTEAGDGIARSVFWLEFTPAGSNDTQRIYYMDTEDTEDEGRTRDLMCVFGGEAGNNNSCDEMPTAEGEGWSMPFPVPNDPRSVMPPNYNRLQAGNYIVYAQVQTTSEVWSAQVSRQFTVPAPEYTWIVPDEDGKEIAAHDESEFEVKAWMPHIGSENGAGIGSIAFEILEGDDPSNATNDVLYSSIDSTGEPFCAFSEQGDKSCKPMPTDDEMLPNFDYYKLPAGTYTIRLMVLYEGQEADWTEWRKIDSGGKPHNYRRFVIPELPAYIDFVYDDSDDELPDNLGYIVDRENQTRFRVRAFAGDQDEVDNKDGTDGDNIELVEFQLLDDMQGQGDKLESTEDLQERYCLFGGSSPCEPMDSIMFDEKMHSETPYHDKSYTIRARAKTELNGGRWTDWVERSFAIPPVEMRFADPDPNPSDDDNNYPEELDDYHQDNDRKVVREEEQTRFEIQAFDPKYLNSLKDKTGEDLYDNVYDANASGTDLDDLYDLYNGVGIDKYEVRFCGPYPDGDCEKSDEIEDPDLNTTQDYTWNANGQDGPGDPMCVFGYDADAEEEEQCEATDDYDQMDRGEYIIKARVANKIYENNGWTYWDQDEWMELEFVIPDVYMAFMNVPNIGKDKTLPFPSEVRNQPTGTNFGFRAYDPKAVNEDFFDGEFQNGSFNEPTSLYFTIQGPSPMNTMVYSKTIPLPNINATNNYCVFGDGFNGPCDPMPEDLYSELPAGDYTIRAQIATADGFFTKEETFKMPYADVTMQFASTYTTTYYVDDLQDEAAAFEVLAYTTGLTPTDNGKGVQQVEFTLVGVDNLGMTFPVMDVLGKDTSVLADTTAPFCPFGSGGTTCKAMTSADKQTLEDAGGEYYILQVRAQQSAADGSRWSAPNQVKFILVP